MNIVITGGCGFIGCNAAQRLSHLGHTVTLLDDLSRSGTQCNLGWLEEMGGFDFVYGDVRDGYLVSEIIRHGSFDVVIHLAAQVAVTTSLSDPGQDFAINAQGTFNVLEAVRLHSPRSIVLNASTNKVYGKLHGPVVSEESGRYCLPTLPDGVGEEQPLDIYSPYGCSKGAADQYVMDYARIYGLRTVNFRQSCIYGCRQFGVEDQGWVAWFLIAHLLERPITIYGTGKQVRDVLFVEDLVDCYLAAIDRIDCVAGMTFNVGGGPANTLSLLELMDRLQELSGRPVCHTFAEWRPGDQPVYVSDIRSAKRILGWQPRVDVTEGLARLSHWVAGNRALFEQRQTGEERVLGRPVDRSDDVREEQYQQAGMGEACDEDGSGDASQSLAERTLLGRP